MATLARTRSVALQTADPSIIHLTHTVPSNNGKGGVHRSYQVLHESQKLVSPDLVLVLTAEQLDQAELDVSKREYSAWGAAQPKL